jgi:hypothetical protein
VFFFFPTSKLFVLSGTPFALHLLHKVLCDLEERVYFGLDLPRALGRELESIEFLYIRLTNDRFPAGTALKLFVQLSTMDMACTHDCAKENDKLI